MDLDEWRGESVLLQLNNEIWPIIIDFIPIRIVSELRFLCRRFHTISTLHNRLNHYRKISHGIFDTGKLYKLFIDNYNNVLFTRFKYYFNLPIVCYLRYRMQFIKNQFLCSHILSHLLDCPRSEFAVNRCYRCSRLHVTKQPTFLLHLKTIY